MEKAEWRLVYLDEEGEIATNQRVDDYFVNDEGHMARTNGFRLKMRSAMTAGFSGRRLLALFWQGRQDCKLPNG
mgnify:CR=1 FL=1